MFSFLKSRVSEICVKRIRVNQGVGVSLFVNHAGKAMHTIAEVIQLLGYQL